MKAFFHPRSVAVIGVSDRDTNLGRQIVANMHEFSFDGIIYLVGPKGGVSFGRRIYHSVMDIPDHVDLAIVLTPAKTVPDIMEELGNKGVRNAIIETAGFREYGEEGRKIEDKIVEIAKKHDIRFIGPNCIGVINRHNGLAVPFAALKNVYPAGGVTIISQSGGVGISYLNALASENIGLNCFASIGNKLNVDECDLLEYFLDDPQTSIICMYLESVSNGKRLMELGAKANKPILLHKSNTGRLSQKIAASHTASISGDDDVLDSALKQCGIARFYEPEQLVNYLKALPMPRIKGKRLAVLSRSGGHAVIAADECERQGFDLAEFPAPFIEEIEQHFRANVIKLSNPLDLGDLFDIDVYRRIIERTLNLPEVDGVVFLHTYVSQTEGEASQNLIEVVMPLAEAAGKPLAVCVETDNIEAARLKHDVHHPVFTDVEDAVRSLAMARDFGKGSAAEDVLTELDINAKPVADILACCKAEGRSPSLSEALCIAEAYGLPTIGAQVAQTEDEAAQAAEALGYPVVMKVIAPEVSHKSDLGGVQLNLKTENGVRAAFNEIMKAIQTGAPGAHIDGILVQRQARSGPEMIVGGKQDPLFGPTVMVGLGGIFVEVFKEVAIRIAPFGREQAEAMIDELTISPIINGIRGQAPYDRAALVDILLRTSRLLADHPQIMELDFNPVRIYHNSDGCRVLDARVILDSDD